MPITITEALQEIKTINNRLTKKRQSIGNFLARDSRLRDPLEKDGGSEKFIVTERQSIKDLEERIVSIRTAIQRSNLETRLALAGFDRSVAEWLTWRREVSTNAQSFLTQTTTAIHQIRQEVQKKGGKVVATVAAVNETSPTAPPEIVVNVNEKTLLEEQDTMEKLLGDLDGRLSLLNATTTISV